MSGDVGDDQLNGGEGDDALADCTSHNVLNGNAGTNSRQASTTGNGSSSLHELPDQDHLPVSSCNCAACIDLHDARAALGDSVPGGLTPGRTSGRPLARATHHADTTAKAQLSGD